MVRMRPVEVRDYNGSVSGIFVSQGAELALRDAFPLALETGVERVSMMSPRWPARSGRWRASSSRA